jgi:hypothetical protein
LQRKVALPLFHQLARVNLDLSASRRKIAFGSITLFPSRENFTSFKLTFCLVVVVVFIFPVLGGSHVTRIICSKQILQFYHECMATPLKVVKIATGCKRKKEKKEKKSCPKITDFDMSLLS